MEATQKTLARKRAGLSIAINTVLLLPFFMMFIMSGMIYDSPQEPQGFDWRPLIVILMGLPLLITAGVVVISLRYAFLGRPAWITQHSRVIFLPTAILAGVCMLGGLISIIGAIIELGMAFPSFFLPHLLNWPYLVVIICAFILLAIVLKKPRL